MLSSLTPRKYGGPLSLTKPWSNFCALQTHLYSCVGKQLGLCNSSTCLIYACRCRSPRNRRTWYNWPETIPSVSDVLKNSPTKRVGSRPPTLREIPIPWSNFAYGYVPNSTREQTISTWWTIEGTFHDGDICFRPGLHNSFLYFILF